MNKPWTRTSASQQEAFKRCQRYWYYGWIEKVERPTTPAQQRGTDIHAESEHYFKKGTVRDSSYTEASLNYRPYVEALIPYLPTPGPEVLVEQRIDMDTGLGVSWIGFIDIAWEEESWNGIIVRDIKSTSDFRYAKTPSELMGNIQAVSYAKWLFDVTEHDGDIDVGLIYVKTEKKVVRKNPKTKLVRVGAEDGFDRAHIEDVWGQEMDVVAQMKVAALADSANELPPTTSACGMFGGCPFGNRCGLTIGDFMPARAKKGNTTMGNKFLKGLKDKSKSNGATATPVPAGTLPPDAPTRETPVAEAKTEPPEESKETKAEAPKKKRGRPKGSSKKKAATTGGFVLYIDCMPTKDTGSEIEPTLFEDWFGTLTQEMNEQVLEEKNLPSYLLLPYSEEKALVALTVQQAVDNLPPALVVTSGTPGAKDALGALVPHATSVIRAMRG
jgi:RecB family exonuclease